jgi:hypothetical protein
MWARVDLEIPELVLPKWGTDPHERSRPLLRRHEGKKNPQAIQHGSTADRAPCPHQLQETHAHITPPKNH